MKALKNTSIFSKYDMIYSVLNLTKQNKTDMKDRQQKERILLLSSQIIEHLNIIPKKYFDESFTNHLDRFKVFNGTDEEAIKVLKNIISRHFRSR
jgi:hypothetical protein